MAQRSTRNKLRWQAKKCIDQLDRIMNHLKVIDEMAQGESKYITETAPRLVVIIQAVRVTFVNFRDGL